MSATPPASVMRCRPQIPARKTQHIYPAFHLVQNGFVLLPVAQKGSMMLSWVRPSPFVIRHSSFSFVIRPSSFIIRHSSFALRHSSFHPKHECDFALAPQPPLA